ncbi:ATP-binding protein [Pseudomonas sp. S07E 245]|uniref:AAA family ATPase n=1 Tax=unclassified Pseudomonas TaxID=196821 RepID=UPI00143CC2F7|nr:MULTISPECIES: AAA family ATPase [unclassified Pseudomonas]QYX54644.1 ATP-binding protein [Pseudomonas sp. S07E 245]
MRKTGFLLREYQDRDFHIPLLDDVKDQGETKVSVVIGPNGSGKSRVLSRIVDAFTYLAELRLGNDQKKTWKMRSFSGFKKIAYRLDGVEYQIKLGEHFSFKCYANDIECNLRSMPFPKQAAVVSHLPVDRFRFVRDDPKSFYKYLGLRQSTNLTTTGALEAKVIQGVLKIYERPKFRRSLESWLSLAGYSDQLSIKISPINDRVLSKDFREVENVLLEMQRPGWVTKQASDGTTVAFNFLQRLKDYPVEGVTYLCDLSSMSDLELSSWRKGYEAARRLRAFRSASLIFSRKNDVEEYPFSELSSGEQQLIGTHSRLLSEIAEDSLVVIDEPEVSLHPEWQMRYIPTLKKCLESISGVHVLIATHSHFMISDLDDKNSSLVIAQKDESSRRCRFELFEGDVYGRSPENILYRAFGVATAGNIYVEDDLRNALQMISGTLPLEQSKLTNIYERLQRVNGPDNIAMNVILERISSFLDAEA